MLEKDVERYLVRKIRAAGGRALKFESPGCTGVPDRMILMPGGHISFAELKRPRKTERARQIYVQSELRRLGFTVYSTVDSFERVDQLLMEVTNGEDL